MNRGDDSAIPRFTPRPFPVRYRRTRQAGRTATTRPSHIDSSALPSKPSVLGVVISRPVCPAMTAVGIAPRPCRSHHLPRRRGPARRRLPRARVGPCSGGRHDQPRGRTSETARKLRSRQPVFGEAGSDRTRRFAIRWEEGSCLRIDETGRSSRRPSKWGGIVTTMSGRRSILATLIALAAGMPPPSHAQAYNPVTQEAQAKLADLGH